MSDTPAAMPVLPLAPLLGAIGDPLRWSILAELARDQPLMVVELARKLGRSDSSISKHLAVLRSAGAVESGRGRLYRIPAAFRRDPATRTIDYGHMLLRFPAAATA